MNSPLKKISKILLGFILFLLIIFLAAYIYIKNYLSEDDIKKYIISFSTNYLNREIKIDKIDLNIFKGIVLKNVTVEKISALTNSTSLFIKEINLRYDYKALLKLKFYISKLIIYNLNIDASADIINSELNYYKNKFATKKTNSQNNILNIKNIEVVDTKIKYNKIMLIINDILFQNGRLKKIDNNINIVYDKYNIHSEGYFYLYKNIYSLKQKINLNNHNIQLNATSIDFTNINITGKFNYKNRDFFVKVNSALYSNVLLNKYIRLSDHNGNVINLLNFKIKLNNYYFSVFADLKLHNINNKTIFINSPKIKADIDAKLKATGFLNNLTKSRLTGSAKINNFSMIISTNSISVKNSTAEIINNKIKLFLSSAQFNKIKMTGNISYKNFFKVYPINVNLTIPELSLLKFTGKNILLSNIKINSIVDFTKKLINFNRLKFTAFGGTFLNTGGHYYFNKYSKNDFYITSKNISIDKINKIFSITNIPLHGTLNNKIKVVFSISSNNKFQILTLKGTAAGKTVYNKIKNRLIINYEKINNNIIIKNSSLNIFRNKILFIGKYNLSDNSVAVSGISPRFNLTSLPDINLKGIANLNFSIIKSKNLSGAINITSSKINFKNILFNNFKTKLNLKNNFIYGNININNFYSGKILSIITNNLKMNKLKLYSKGIKIDVSKLLKNNVKGDISGTLNFNTALTKHNKDLTGNIDFNITKGEIVNTEFQKGLGGFMNLLEGLGDIFYNSITGNIQLNNNTVKISKIDISCIDQRYLISGIYYSDTKNLNIEVQPAFREDFVENIPNFALQVISHKNNWYYIKNVKIIRKNNKFIYKWKK